MKNLWLGFRSVLDKLGIVHRYPEDLSKGADILPLTASQVKMVHSGVAAEFREIELIATNQIKSGPFGRKRLCQTEYVGLVATAGEQGHRDLVRLPWDRQIGRFSKALESIIGIRAHIWSQFGPSIFRNFCVDERLALPRLLTTRYAGL